jgi:hypothetical protein
MPEWNLKSNNIDSCYRRMIHYLPSPIVNLDKNIIEDSIVLCVLLKALEAVNMVFIYVLVESSCKGNLSLDTCDLFIDATLNLSKISKREKSHKNNKNLQQ